MLQHTLYLVFLLLMTQLTEYDSKKAEILTDDSKMKGAAELDSLFSSLFKSDELGAAVLVVRGNSIVYDRGFGLARLDTITPITSRTMFNICSVSKQFSAMALFILAEQGKLSLDDPVKKYFPKFKADFFNRITLRHLLSHTSGLPDARPRTQAEWERYISHTKTRFKNVEDFKRFCEEDESCRYLEDLDSLGFEPGTKYEYQNPTFQLILMIVEKVTGEKFDDWMKQHVFLPADMKETTYFDPDKFIPDMAHAYIPAKGSSKGYFRSENGKWEECDYGEANFFGTKADGGIYTTPLEFVKWDKVLYSDKLISAAMRKEAHTGKIVTDIAYTDYGYGWFIEHRPDRPRKIYHTGDNGGFYIFEGRFPDKNLFYLIFANRPDWDRDAMVEKVDIILEKAGWLK